MYEPLSVFYEESSEESPRGSGLPSGIRPRLYYHTSPDVGIRLLEL